jgi:hypothetical protein
VQGLDEIALLAGALTTAYGSIRSGFEDYLTQYNDGRPIIFIGHSQGAVMLMQLLSSLVENDASLRSRLVLAILLGGNVTVPTGKLTGGSFSTIPVCVFSGEAGCVIAYSSFPSTPPASSAFGRPGQGVSLLAGQFATAGLEVVCVNPAHIGGGSAALDPFFPAHIGGDSAELDPFHGSEGRLMTPWVEYPSLYRASCEHRDGATWLQVSKGSGVPDRRPVVRETPNPAYNGRFGVDWGYHVYDVNLALGNLVADVAAAEGSWSH